MASTSVSSAALTSSALPDQVAGATFDGTSMLQRRHGGTWLIMLSTTIALGLLMASSMIAVAAFISP